MKSCSRWRLCSCEKSLVAAQGHKDFTTRSKLNAQSQSCFSKKEAVYHRLIPIASEGVSVSRQSHSRRPQPSEKAKHDGESNQ